MADPDPERADEAKSDTGEVAEASEPVNESDLESSDSKELIIPKANQLIPPQPLGENCGKEKYRIISYYPDRFNSFDVISENEKDVDLFHLCEEIDDVIELPDCTLKRPPEIRDVVLAPTKEGRYHRAVILKIISDSKVLVYHIDAGGKLVVDTTSLRMMSKGLIKVPILAHHVVLQDMPATSGWILSSLFSQSMAKLINHCYTIEMGDVNPNKGLLSPSHKVVMSFMVDTRKKPLVDEINALKIWEWEKYSNLVGTDAELCQNGKYGIKTRSNSEQTPIMNFPLTVGAKFNALVSRVVADSLDPEIANLHITHLDDPKYINYYNVLYNQLQRLAEHIKPSSFFPANQESLMFKMVTTDDTESKSRSKEFVKEADRWVRALRLDHAIYLMDLDDMVPYTELPNNAFQFRQLYKEFFKVPLLNILIRVKENGKPIPIEEARKKFEGEGRVFLNFTITGTCSASPDIYEAEYELP